MYSDFVNLGVRRKLGKISQTMFPSVGNCHYCEMSWRIVLSHSTDFNEYGSGLFPLCEDCWSQLTIQERLPFYRELFDKWCSDGSKDLNGTLWEDVWAGIEASVLNNQ